MRVMGRRFLRNCITCFGLNVLTPIIMLRVERISIRGQNLVSPPILPHGLNEIIIGHDCVIGKNCTIFQQVTIAHGGVRIGDNVLIGAGAKILPGVAIGHNVKVGANCVVVEDVPDNATVVLPKPRIIVQA